MSKASRKAINGYRLENQGNFIIENYNEAKPFSNFFPGIAGVCGIPMWVFYANRGQGITSFGIESKNKAIMEFLPANKAYRLSSTQGFRTFIKATSSGKTRYWEPFQANLKGTDYRRTQTMRIASHDLTLQEANQDLGLIITVNYFTLPEEPYAGLIRRVSIENTKRTAVNLEVVDGLPLIIPFGINDWLIKNMARTVEAWVAVRNVKSGAPYYQLNVEVSDNPKVTHIREGNFYFSFDEKGTLWAPIVEASAVFGAALDFSAPERFLEKGFKVPDFQRTDNRTPAALSYGKLSIKGKGTKTFTSMAGFAFSLDQLKRIVKRSTAKGYIEERAQRNQAIIDELKNNALTVSASASFDHYCQQNFLDNILRGGLPLSLKTSEGNAVFNVYSRKHGDMERDYNFFTLAPTFYSQGNGNYRDVNQNRRNDGWFNTDVKDSHLLGFMNLIQADGYNPLVVKGTSFVVEDKNALADLASETVNEADQATLKEYLMHEFYPGDLWHFIEHRGIKLKIPFDQFLGKALNVSHKHESAQHTEGFWTDHWTYNLDLLESYLALYPEELENVLLGKKAFYYYFNTHYILPRDKRLILTERGVRQYHAVGQLDEEELASVAGNRLRVKNGKESIYRSDLLGKYLCLLANKAASLDPSGIGVEMEADKPNWYDALNGLPGLLGSSISETLEIRRTTHFLLAALDQLAVKDSRTVDVFEELSVFINELTGVLAVEAEPLAYWQKANDIKEHYRSRIRYGVTGVDQAISIKDIKKFLNLILQKTEKSLTRAINVKGELVTYLYHEVVEYSKLSEAAEDGKTYVRPLKFKRIDLPLFLEGYVHALRSEEVKESARKFYQSVQKSALFDKKLKMYKVNADLGGQTEEIGRARIFPRGWLENESIWLHMEYKFMLELLRKGLVEEFYENFKHVMVPFMNPSTYGRNILENSSFIASSAHEDNQIHGQGFVARLSGSTAEFIHIWLLMNVGCAPFSLGPDKKLQLEFKPQLPGWLFTRQPQKVQNITLPANIYAFRFLNRTLVVYHNPKKLDTFGKNSAQISEVRLTYPDRKAPVILTSSQIPGPYALDVREGKVERIDLFLK